MLLLNDLRDKPKSRKVYKRVGRGKSHSPGHGGKGQTARTGVALGNFQGGQTPLERRLPKLGWIYNPDKIATVTMKMLERLIDSGAVNDKIDCCLLKRHKMIKKTCQFKVVGACTRKMHIISDGISAGALESLKAVGGTWEKVGDK